MRLTRRALLAGASALAFAGYAPAAARLGIRRVEPVPARFVHLLPSRYADAQAANRRYVLSLDPERLLHNFYVSAGLPASRPGYGGWEAQGIAGHTLGHWLSACSLLIANTGDGALASSLDHALAEMARIQAAHGDGYCAGTTVEREGRTVDGKVVFDEIRRGDIRSQGFDLNGGWVPLYTWHKVHAGLLDAHVLAGNPRALPIALGIAGYLAGVLEPLSDDQMQRVLAAEHGGLNESYAETYALTGDPRWLRMAEKIRHKAVLDPLTARQDRLAGLHANTQIPKLIGLARLHELTGDPGQATAARFFHDRVAHHHSYVIGGNSEREHFGEADRLAGRITEATCEACNSYNMLKLTRHLYSWSPHARWFDYYERVQLNHILAHQRPDTGAFVYFMPLASGARRTFSSSEDSFWCCVGSGMESHAKHADSIFWADEATLFVNLYIPSRLDWPGRDLALTLDTTMPDRGEVTLTVRRAPRRHTAIALRLPSWSKGPTLVLNGDRVPTTARDGYQVVERRWRAGDRLQLTLPMEVALEPVPDDATVVAFVHGPTVLAADLGNAAEPFDGVAPALVAAEATAATGGATSDGPLTIRTVTGGLLRMRPFAEGYDRRSAVYFPTFTPEGWAAARGGYLARQADALALAKRTVDILPLGEMQPERDHAVEAGRSEVVNWNGRSARHLRAGDTLRFHLARRPGAAILRLVVWGDFVERPIGVTVDGSDAGKAIRHGTREDRFAFIDHPLPQAGEQGRDIAVVALTAIDGDVVIYEAGMLTAASGAPPVAAT